MSGQAFGTHRPLLVAFFIVALFMFSIFRVPVASAQNTAPNADAGKDFTVAVAVEAHFHGTATDADGYLTKYEWDYEGDGTFDTLSTSTGEATWTYQAVGVYNAVLKVTDNDGGQDNDTVKVTVVEGNTPPTADAGKDKQVHAMELVTFVGIGKDLDGKIVKYEWDFDGDKKYDWTNTKNGTTTWIYTIAATYYATFRVTDDGALPANATATIKVLVYPPNKPPVAKAGVDVTVHALETFRVKGTAYDVDGKITKYSWDFNGDHIPDRESPVTGETLYSYDTPGTYTAVLTVTDNAELPSTGTDSIKITVLAPNVPPSATALPAVTATVGNLLFFNGSGSDTDGHIEVYKWDFYGNGTYGWSSSHNGSTYWVYDKPGTYNAKFTVVDDVGATANATRTVTIVPKKAKPAAPVMEFNLGFVVALLIGIGIGVAAGVGAAYGYLHISIARKYKKVKELEAVHGGAEDATFRGTQVGEREPPSFRGGGDGFE
jgi:PKD repeat protein